MATGVDALLRTARARLRRLTPAEAYTAAAAGGVIVDIRSDGQRAADGLVPGALVVPRNVLEWRADPGSPERDPRIVQATGPAASSRGARPACPWSAQTRTAPQPTGTGRTPRAVPRA